MKTCKTVNRCPLKKRKKQRNKIGREGGARVSRACSSRGLAPRALAQELRRKGVDDEEAKAALEQIDEDDQRAAARALVDRNAPVARTSDVT